MPRKRKTMTGQPAQPIKAVPGTGYGQGVRQEAIARQLPAPSVRSEPVRPASPRSAMPAPSPRTAPTAPPPRPPQNAPQPVTQAQPADLMQIAQSMRNQGLLAEPTRRPNEPVTAGLAVGPGVGPEGLARPYGSPLADLLNRLAKTTGDPYFSDLANRGRV